MSESHGEQAPAHQHVHPGHDHAGHDHAGHDHAGHYHAYTHGYEDAVLSSHRNRTAQNSAAHLLPHLREGMRLLDVGSGAGTITADLARIVGPQNVTALEVSEESAAITRAELERQGLEGVDVRAADAHAIPFADGSFDVVHTHQVLHHVADPVQVLREMRRVTAPGGIVSAREADYGAFRWWPELPGLARWRELFIEAMEANGGTPDAGRRLLGWALEAGLEGAEPGSSTWCYATPADRAFWAGSSSQRITAGAVAQQLVREGRASQDQLDEIGADWRRWAEDPAGWFVLLHGEIIARV
ncbi:SAM-dependent methyltransferase [Brachybacterium endophyticum]|uniref:SAM-dependent methyltransferase n=1 Tax=Brachybacterium endophyticum TaxID=2182385 RepID=A0A2U2RJV8_9MICO|nr:class I SAM-dependent methyltransferase [Brachybacterium endophyticum]PWH06064.1 SAM-dependent methyltransferase [Brachybacterium endophyticum]